jgi:hypothetical protein
MGVESLAMRARLALLSIFGVAGLAGAAVAQPPTPTPQQLQMQNQALLRSQLADQSQLAILRAEQDRLAREQVIQQNELSRLDNLARARDAAATVQAQSATPQIVPPPASGAQRSIDVSGLASIPDSALAESNARVKAAAENRP